MDRALNWLTDKFAPLGEYMKAPLLKMTQSVVLSSQPDPKNHYF